jgi:hypothetical protein
VLCCAKDSERERDRSGAGTAELWSGSGVVGSDWEWGIGSEWAWEWGIGTVSGLWVWESGSWYSEWAVGLGVGYWYSEWAVGRSVRIMVSGKVRFSFLEPPTLPPCRPAAPCAHTAPLTWYHRPPQPELCQAAARTAAPVNRQPAGSVTVRFA